MNTGKNAVTFTKIMLTHKSQTHLSYVYTHTKSKSEYKNTRMSVVPMRIKPLPEMLATYMDTVGFLAALLAIQLSDSRRWPTCLRLCTHTEVPK